MIHSSRNAYKVFLLSDQLPKFFVSVECQQLHEVPAVQSLATKHPCLLDVLGASQDIAMIGQGYITIVLLYLVFLFRLKDFELTSSALALLLGSALISSCLSSLMQSWLDMLEVLQTNF